MNPERRTAAWRLHQSCKTIPSLAFLLLAACGGGGGSAPPITDPDVQTVGCTDNSGLDLFAAETVEALGLSWNNQAAFDASGGYRVRYGTVSEIYNAEKSVDCTSLDCETTLVGLNNDTNLLIRLTLEVA